MKQMAPLFQRIYNLFARGIVLASDDEKKLERLQLRSLGGETLDGIERLGMYGFASRPLDGAEVLVVFPNGDRTQGYVIAVEDRRYRPKDLVKGESCQFTDEGTRVHLRRNRQCLITAQKFNVFSDDDQLMDIFRGVASAAKSIAVALAGATVTTPDGAFPLNNAGDFTTLASTLTTLGSRIEEMTGG